MCEALDIDPERLPLTLPDRTATWARPRCRSPWPRRPSRCDAGDRVLLLGIGSGLNTSCAEIVW